MLCGHSCKPVAGETRGVDVVQPESTHVVQHKFLSVQLLQTHVERAYGSVVAISKPSRSMVVTQLRVATGNFGR